MGDKKVFLTSELSEEDQNFLLSVMRENFEKVTKTPEQAHRCSCAGCSCPSRSTYVCDGGSYAGYAGGYYGSLIG